VKHVLKIIIILIVIVYGCCKSDKFTENSGSIIADFQYDYSCIRPSLSKNVIIKDSSSYHLAFRIDSSFNNFERCHLLKLPDIDFTKYSILGNYKDGGCDAVFKRNVRIDTNTKAITYSISVKDCGMCKVETFNYNFVIIPKIPNDYVVEFK
jgi:hypothetical protein